ncbi:MAG: glycosyltransferase [Clostridia bacterium]|nr:glycosyltransferase [Clostridia bacterium]
MADFFMIATGILAGIFLFFRFPILRKQESASPKKNSSPLKISVIIPCRNEEHNIGELLDALAAQTYPVYEIICVDDISEDRTADIVCAKGARLIRIEAHAEGWIGKPYALQTGAEAATGEILLFLDADLKLANDALETLAKAYETHGTLSVQPYHTMKKGYEQLALFFNLSAVAGTGITLPVPKQRGMFGPVIMIEKVLYFKHGGHSAIKNCIVEDYLLGLHYQKSGIAYKLFLGGKNIAFRMYPDGIRTQLEGFAKNISKGILSSGFLTVIMTFAWITALCATPVQLILSAIAGNTVQTGLAAGFYGVILLHLCFISAKIGNYKPYLIPLYPVALVWFILVILYSFLRKLFFRTANWKGRKIKI